MSLFKLLLSCSLVLAVHLQIVPESVKITNLPDQNQDFYHGWLKTSNEPESYLYYQLFSAEGTTFKGSDLNSSQIPLLVYLEGGPGQSSVFISWSGFGPYGVHSNINFTGNNTPEDLEFTVFKKNVTWAQYSHLLTIDSPIQTGFSFSRPEVLLNNTDDLVDHLTVFLRRFYEIYPQLMDNRMYIMGNSYGGHWASYLTFVLKKNSSLTLVNNQRYNLAGTIMIVPLLDPKLESKVVSDFLFAAGVTDPQGKQVLKEQFEDKIEELLESGQLVEACGLFHKYAEERFIEPHTSKIARTNNRLQPILQTFALRNLEYNVPSQTFFNISIPTVYSARTLLNIPSFLEFYMMGYAKQPFLEGSDTALQLGYQIEYLLDQDINVIIFAAQDDNAFPAIYLAKLVGSLNWKGKAGFKRAERKLLKTEDGDGLGFSKKYKNLHFMTILNSGHLIMMDQLPVITNFIKMAVVGE